MKLGLCTQVLSHLPLDRAISIAVDHGIEALELPVHPGNAWVDVQRALAGDDTVLHAITRAGLDVSSLSVHQVSQLVLGPHGPDTAAVHAGTPEERVAWAQRQVRDAARLAARWGIPVLVGFTGCVAWHRTFPWPLSDGWQADLSTLRERWMPVLDDLAACGVRFAHECHPNQQLYDLDSARAGLDALDHHPALAFNVDVANLALADIDPVVFIEAMHDRVVHVHAKDMERVRHHQGSGLLAHGPWDRPGRGVRFRVPGWGDLDWRRIITALRVAGYAGALCIEHEDPTMSRLEGLTQAVRHLQPLLLRAPPEPRWW